MWPIQPDSDRAILPECDALNLRTNEFKDRSERDKFLRRKPADASSRGDFEREFDAQLGRDSVSNKDDDQDVPDAKLCDFGVWKGQIDLGHLVTE